MKIKQIKSINRKAILFAFAIIFFVSINSIAQESSINLVLNDSIEGEIKGGEKDSYTVSLSINKTARIELVQKGIDLNFEAFDLQGKSFIIGISPSGLFGDESILVTAKEAGEYRVEVSSADPNSQPGKYRIMLTEIRPTVEEDFKINEATARILELAQEATRSKYNGTIEGLRDALAKWDETIALSKIKKDRVWEGVAIVAKGLIYKQLGEFQNALDAFLQSLGIWRELSNRQYEGSTVNNIGIAYSDLGQYEKSLLFYQQAGNINREVGNRKSLGYSLNNIAWSYQKLGDYQQAEKYFRQSLEIKRETKTIRGKRAIATTTKNLGYTLALKGDIANGLKLVRESLELRREIDYKWGIADSLLTLGKLEKEDNLENLTQASKLASDVGDRRLQAESHYLIAIAQEQRGNLDAAIENIKKGLAIVENIRSEIVGSESRYSYFSTIQGYYELYTDLLILRSEKTKSQKNIRLALEISERSRSRSLVDLLREANVDFKKGNSSKLLIEQKNLIIQLNDEFARRRNLLSGAPKPEQVANINSEINDLETKIQSLNLKIRRQNPKFADLSEGKILTSNAIQNLLDDGTILLEYKLGKERGHLWFVSNKSIEHFVLPPRKEILTEAQTFYRKLVGIGKGGSDNRSVNNLSKRLHELLLGKVEKQIKGKRVAIVADDILQYLPFSALRDSSGAFLAEKSEIVTLPSVSVLAELRLYKTDAEKSLLVFADPVFDLEDARFTDQPQSLNAGLAKITRDFLFGEKLPRLLASRREARNILKSINNTQALVLTDFDANIENITNKDLADYKILHFATHGLLNTKNPELSGLVFSLYDENGKTRDGFLTLNDIYNLELSSDMVVLSACQTALGKEIRGEGLIGLSRGFLYAGSKRVVATLWKVDDVATAEFMKRFYRNHLEKNMSASYALQQTKLEMKKIKRYQSPYYWSAFILIGDWR